MQVVLLERVEKLGAIGDVVTVKPGYARNFLLPQSKALRATQANMERFEREREVIEKLNAERAEKAREEGSHLDGATFVLIRQASESGQLYGSVSTRDIADAASTPEFNVSRGMVDLNTAIKTLGLHEVRLVLHADVDVTVTINVARTEDEAERQAQGEDVIQAAADEDRALAEAQAVELAESGVEGDDDDYESSSEASEETEETED
ncbi:MAG: 50S ribosomal protein L9 [Oceanicaulis sp.]|jgi:large subunit ribosomal protein L9|uniref:50S ribosomal protein L9 n=1 Tax=unclassified Oceanicaulis TaxID=2632123 RepID=UPI000C595A61|nr:MULTISPECIES: 50S ribosomal protein L9 [unclassified Oceanicaulis]MAB70209.1 50S ribosomal protein L9 [Oceanicaulis sp.]MBC38294.1 50S ribosomal protein L9 [Oceanicaulis sp.]MBG36445.1 50S ribosomal protein L9 [Oceanicaulis sp.]|tara:strand:+ start:1115 stop:1735 length:621 start_codon:yes stop_codon:yes gene_type:complete